MMSWSGRYLSRLLGRNLGRSLLSLLLAALLAFAFGLVTVLRGIYAELYRDVEVKAVFAGGLSYDRALKIADSGYVRDPYYEYTVQNGQVEMEGTFIVLTNRLDRQTSDPVDWLEGWDESAAMNSEERVLVMYESKAEELGVSLGDMVRVNETDWFHHVSGMGQTTLGPGETELDMRDRFRPFFQVVGIIHSPQRIETVFIPAVARYRVVFLVPKLDLDIAEYTLVDYHQAAEFKDYARGELDKNLNQVRFTLDTSYADRIYQMHRLLETLYPLTVAAALLLGAVLPGLIVLHASRELSILRALGAKVGRCVGLYALAQALCALVGLALGTVLVLAVRRPELNTVARAFALYTAAHLAACAVGSGAFAWACARKHVLAQLTARE